MELIVTISVHLFTRATLQESRGLSRGIYDQTAEAIFYFLGLKKNLILCFVGGEGFGCKPESYRSNNEEW